jgi:uncharacterized protein YbaR (Trm112 family)
MCLFICFEDKQKPCADDIPVMIEDEARTLSSEDVEKLK